MAFTDYLTAEGERLLAKSIADAEPIVFTKVAMGSGYLPQDTSEKNVSELVSEEKTLDVTTVSLNDNSSIVVTAYFNNEGLTDGFYFREKGIYMKVGEDEVLGIYGNAGSTAEYIDTTEECVIEKSLRTILHMTSDELKNVQLWNGTAAVAPLIIKGITLSDFVKTDTALSVTVGQQVIIDKAIYVFTGGDQRDVDNYSRGVLISDVYEEQIAGANEHGGMAASQNAVYFVYRELDNHSNAKATTSVLGHVKLSDSSAVTDSTGLALPATEKNAAIGGTLANQISKVNSDLEKKVNCGETSFPTLGGLELSSNTPLIDFHFGGDTGDYTSRIIESQKGLLEIIGKVNFKSGGIEMEGHTIGSVGDIFLNDKGAFLNAILTNMNSDLEKKFNKNLFTVSSNVDEIISNVNKNGLSVIRTNNTDIPNMHCHGSGIAFANNDTYGYLDFAFNMPAIYVGGGNTAKTGHWRDSLVLKSDIITEKFTADNQKIPASTYGDIDISVDKSGYTPIGIIGFDFNNASTNGANSSRCTPYSMYLNGNKAHFDIRNDATNDAIIKATVTVLFIRT